MMMSMRTLITRIKKLVPSIEARREGEGRNLGDVTQMRNIIRNLATSLEENMVEFTLDL